jgi:hypothetical protein
MPTATSANIVLVRAPPTQLTHSPESCAPARILGKAKDNLRSKEKDKKQIAFFTDNSIGVADASLYYSRLPPFF